MTFADTKPAETWRCDDCTRPYPYDVAAPACDHRGGLLCDNCWPADCVRCQFDLEDNLAGEPT
jgi:hypothetical protein